MRTAQVTALLCFNGAALVRARREECGERGRPIESSLLQWSRARESAESREERATALTTNQLQWSRARESAERR